MRLEPRDYQDQAVKSVFTYFENGNKGNPIVVMPTGTGKALVISELCERIIKQYPNQKILVLTHVKELIEQNYKRLMEQWPGAPAGVNSAGLKRRDYVNPIVFAGIGSVAKKPQDFGRVDLIIIDECHLVSPNSMTLYRKFISALMEVNPHLKVIGTTATPWRMGQGKLTDPGGIFTDFCFNITDEASFNRLIAEGYLMPLIPQRTTFEYDLDGVSISAGDFNQKKLQETVDLDYLTERACREMLEQAYDRNRWLVFSSGVEHAVHTAEILNSLGVDARVVHGGNKEFPMSSQERDDNIAWFKEPSEEIRAIVNNNVLTTGFDHPAIDMLGILRPTVSASLWVQILGRGTRPLFEPGFDINTIEGRLASIAASPKKDCLVLDFGANTKRLGAINNPVLPRKKGKGKGEAPMKDCDSCKLYVPAGTHFCPRCGYEFIFTTKLKDASSTDALVIGELPVVEDIKIDNITYSSYKKHDRPETLQVTYYSGISRYREWICLEHTGFAGKKARDWWRERDNTGSETVPTTVDEALERVGTLKASTSIRVWVNKKYPEIMKHCFDGTHFGKHELNVDETVEQCAETLDGISRWRLGERINQTEVQDTGNATYTEPPMDFDDDIPF